MLEDIIKLHWMLRGSLYGESPLICRDDDGDDGDDDGGDDAGGDDYGGDDYGGDYGGDPEGDYGGDPESDYDFDVAGPETDLGAVDDAYGDLGGPDDYGSVDDAYGDLGGPDDYGSVDDAYGDLGGPSDITDDAYGDLGGPDYGAPEGYDDPTGQDYPDYGVPDIDPFGTFEVPDINAPASPGPTGQDAMAQASPTDLTSISSQSRGAGPGWGIGPGLQAPVAVGPDSTRGEKEGLATVGIGGPQGFGAFGTFDLGSVPEISALGRDAVAEPEPGAFGYSPDISAPEQGFGSTPGATASAPGPGPGGDPSGVPGSMAALDPPPEQPATPPPDQTLEDYPLPLGVPNINEYPEPTVPSWGPNAPQGSPPSTELARSGIIDSIVNSIIGRAQAAPATPSWEDPNKAFQDRVIGRDKSGPDDYLLEVPDVVPSVPPNFGWVDEKEKEEKEGRGNLEDLWGGVGARGNPNAISVQTEPVTASPTPTSYPEPDFTLEQPAPPMIGFPRGYVDRSPTQSERDKSETPTDPWATPPAPPDWPGIPPEPTPAQTPANDPYGFINNPTPIEQRGDLFGKGQTLDITRDVPMPPSRPGNIPQDVPAAPPPTPAPPPPVPPQPVQQPQQPQPGVPIQPAPPDWPGWPQEPTQDLIADQSGYQAPAQQSAMAQPQPEPEVAPLPPALQSWSTPAGVSRAQNVPQLPPVQPGGGLAPPQFMPEQTLPGGAPIRQRTLTDKQREEITRAILAGQYSNPGVPV